MPQTPHAEKHFTGGHTVRDIVIGMSDGLTVPFALAAGLSGATDSAAIILTAGLAEVAAGAIAMGLGGYLAANSDAEHYASELKREQREIQAIPRAERAEVFELLTGFGLQADEAMRVVDALAQRPQQWAEFMMRYELGLERPQPHRATISALTIGSAYVVGGIIPLAPYIAVRDAPTALLISIGVTLCALSTFGWVKGHYTGGRPWRSSAETVLVGSLAAAAAYGLAQAIGGAGG